jgi:serine/threonine protein kinase
VAVPENIGKYRECRKLGSGRVGTVYLCRDDIHREVALKVVECDNAEKVENLDQEASILALLGAARHPGIPVLYQRYATQGEFHCIALEYIAGPSVGEMMTRKDLSINEAVRIAISVAETLQVIHENQVLHLDVKPDNILLRPDGQAVLIDYGTSITQERFNGRDIDTLEVGGTPPFMAPEVVNNEMHTFDPRIDVFSLGVMLSHMFEQRIGNTSEELILACKKAMTEKPSDRFSSARDFADALRLTTEADSSKRSSDSVVKFISSLIELSDLVPGRTDQFGSRTPLQVIKPSEWLHRDLSTWFKSAVQYLREIQSLSRSIARSADFARSQSALVSLLEEHDRDIAIEACDSECISCLWTLFEGSYATGNLEIVVGFISSHAHDADWWSLIPKILKANDYVVRYAAASGQALRLHDRLRSNDPTIVAAAQCEVWGLLSHREEAIKTRHRSGFYSRDENTVCSLPIALCGLTNSQEMGCYVVAELFRTIANDIPEWFDLSWIERMIEIPLYFSRSALCDLLITWAIHSPKRVAAFMKRFPILRDEIWEHIQLDKDVIDAILPKKKDESERAKVDRGYLEQSQMLCEVELLPALWKFPNTSQVVRSYLKRDVALEDKGLVEELGRIFSEPFDAEIAVKLTIFLMSHPLWSKAEQVAAVLAGLANRSECSARVFYVVDQLVKHPNWRVQYGAIEASFLFRQIDDRRDANDSAVTRFDCHLCQFYEHNVSRIRGLCCEDFVGDLLDREPNKWKYRLDGTLPSGVKCDQVLARWLQDDDCWVLEHVYRLFHFVFSTENSPSQGLSKELQSWFQSQLNQLPVETLLGGIPEWHSMDRDRFLELLETAKRDLKAQQRMKPTGGKKPRSR